jgi:hypothetical protein
VWLSNSWIPRYRTKLWDEETPITMHVEPGALAESGLLPLSRSILYLDRAKLEEDREALKQFVNEGGIVISPEELNDIETFEPEIGPGKKFWEALPNRKRPSKTQPKDHREEIDPGFDIADITYHRQNWRSQQRFAFDIDALRPVIAVLPMEAAPGWTATLDGKPLTTFATGPDMVGVLVPKGAHRLLFTWKMPSLGWISLLMTFFGLLVVAGIWLVSAWQWVRRVKARK